jgi:hypothetical protein
MLSPERNQIFKAINSFLERFFIFTDILHIYMEDKESIHLQNIISSFDSIHEEIHNIKDLVISFERDIPKT